MTPFEATHKKTEMAPLGRQGKDVRCTPMSKLAYLINSDWIYSAYWKKEDYQWIEKAQEDLTTELLLMNNRRNDLLQALGILNSIEAIGNIHEQPELLTKG